MTALGEYEYRYWRVFNRLRKIVGHCFLWVGLYGVGLLAIYFFAPELLSAMDRFSEDMAAFDNIGPESMGAFALIALVGYLLIRMTPYLPKRLREYAAENNLESLK
jgi:hypothetical protein